MSVGLTFFGYFLSFLLETAVLVVGIFHLSKHPVRLRFHQENYLLFGIVLCYVLNLLEKVVKDGVNSRWFYLIHPLANLSPFLFTLSFLAIFMPERIKQAFRAVCGIMCPAMILAGIYNTVTRIFAFQPWLYTCIIFDNFGHILFGLYGFIILQNRVVVYTRKTKIAACGFVFGTALTVLLINAVFKTSFFGLHLYGEHNIYNLVLTKSSALSALLYFAGLCGLLALGCHVSDVVQKRLPKQAESEDVYARI